MGRNRAARRGGRKEPTTKDLLLVWRGVLLVGVGGAGIAGLGVAYYGRRGDALVAGLFAASLLALFALGIYATRRVRRLLREG